MTKNFSPYSQALAPTLGQPYQPAVGRSILIVCPSERHRHRWAHAVSRLGYRPIVAETPTEGRRLLSSLVLQAAIVGRDPDCTAMERACSSLLLVALGSVPTLVVTVRTRDETRGPVWVALVSEPTLVMSDEASDDLDAVRQSQHPLGLAYPPHVLVMGEISKFRLEQYLSEPTRRN